MLGLPATISFIAFVSDVPRRHFKKKWGGGIIHFVLNFLNSSNKKTCILEKFCFVTVHLL